jgi:hypothetical protein
MRHQHCEAAIAGRDGGNALGTAVGIERILLGGAALVVDETHRY